MAKKETKPTTTAKPKADQSTEMFKTIVKTYLDKRAEQDELFAKTYAKPNKSIDECIAYIIQEVRKANRIGWANSEIWNLAIHYYDEDSIKVTGSMPNVSIVHTNGHDDTPLRPATPKPTTPSKPTTTPPKSTTPTPQKPTQPSKPSESKPSTTANKPQYAASLFDL
jgi:hypothetical protein